MVTILRGLPASGKSTFAKDLVAKNGMYKRINRDDLRDMIDGGKYGQGKERFIRRAELALADLYLTAGFSIVVDDCNLSESAMSMWMKFVQDHQAKYEIQNFTDVPLETCIERDLKRPNSVGERVIRKMYNDYLKPSPPTIEYDPNLPYCTLVDLDGTMCLLNGRDPYDASTCGQDLPNEPVVWHVQHLLDQGEKVIFVSGRLETVRPQTESWLSTHLVGNYEALYMRSAGDMRKDWIIKQELYERHIKGRYNVRYILDDRTQVIEMWRGLGLAVFQVAESPD